MFNHNLTAFVYAIDCGNGCAFRWNAEKLIFDILKNKKCYAIGEPFA